MTPLHASTVTAKGGREGFLRSDNGVIDLPLTMLRVLGGKGEGRCRGWTEPGPRSS
jgi:hypothetical protein